MSTINDLWKAVRDANTHLALQYLREGVNPHFIIDGATDDTLLHYVFRNCDDSLVHLLILFGARLYTANKAGVRVADLMIKQPLRFPEFLEDFDFGTLTSVRLQARYAVSIHSAVANRHRSILDYYLDGVKSVLHKKWGCERIQIDYAGVEKSALHFCLDHYDSETLGRLLRENPRLDSQVKSKTPVQRSTNRIKCLKLFAQHALPSDARDTFQYGHAVLEAARDGENALALAFLQKGGRFDRTRDAFGGKNTPLHYLSRYAETPANLDILRQFIALAPGSLFLANDKTNTPLIHAAKKAYWKNLRVMLEHRGIPLNYLEKVLTIAVKDNQEEIVLDLLNRGVDPSAQAFEGSSAVQWAAKNKNYKILNLLLIHGALLNPASIMDGVSIDELMRHNPFCELSRRDRNVYLQRIAENIYESLRLGKPDYAVYYLTVVYAHMQRGWPDLERTTLLLQPAHIRAELPSIMHLAIDIADIRLIRLLLQNGGSRFITHPNKKKENALHYSINQNRVDIFNLLFELVVGLNDDKDSFQFGLAALYAASKGLWDVVRSIIRHPTTKALWHMNPGGETLLHYVVSQAGFNKEELQACIFSSKQYFTRRNAKNETALVLAAKNQQWGYVDTMLELSTKLIDDDADFTGALEHSVAAGPIELIARLIELGADTHRLTPVSQEHLLRRSILSGHRPLIHTLLWMGMDFTQLRVSGWAAFKRINILEIARDSKASLRVKVPQKNMREWQQKIRHALLSAVVHNDPDLISLYFELIPNVFGTNAMSMPCASEADECLLYWAIRNGNLKLFYILLEAGASITHQHNKQTPLAFAASSGKWIYVMGIINKHYKTSTGKYRIPSHQDEGQCGSVLLSAVQQKMYGEANSLFQIGFSAHWPDQNGMRILHYLALSDDEGAVELIRRILSKNINTLYDLTKDNESPISLAAKHGRFDRVLLMLSILQQQSVGVESYLRTEAYLNKVLLRAYSAKEGKTVDFLMQKRIDINAHDDQGANLLDLALAANDDATAFYCTPFLLRNLRAYSGEQLIGFIGKAITGRCHEFLIQLIVEVLPQFIALSGADLDITTMFKRGEHQDSPLHYFARQKAYRVVRVLAQNGFNLQLLNQVGETPLSIALNNNDIEMTLLLLEYAGEDTLLLYKIGLKQLIIESQQHIQLFMDKGALLQDINTPLREVEELRIYSLLQLDDLQTCPIKINRLVPVNLRLENIGQLDILMRYDSVDMRKVTFSSDFNLNAFNAVTDKQFLFLARQVDRTQLTPLQYHALLICSYRFYPKEQQSRLIEQRLKNHMPTGGNDKLIASLNNGQLFSFASWLDTALQFITPENPLYDMMNTDIMRINFAFKRQVYDFVVGTLPSILRAKQWPRTGPAQYAFLDTLMHLVHQDVDLPISERVTAKMRLVLDAVIRYRNEQLERPDAHDLYHEPNSLANRVYLMLCWLLAHSKNYKLKDLLPRRAGEDELKETLNSLALEDVNFSDLLLLQVTINQAVIPESHALFYSAALIRQNFQSLNIVKCYRDDDQHELFNDQEMRQLFSSCLPLHDDLRIGHERELVKNRITRGQLTDKTLDTIYRFGEDCWQNSIDSINAVTGRQNIFNEDLAFRLQSEFKAFIESLSEAEKNILLTLEVNVAVRGNRPCSFTKLFNEMTYDGCSGQLGKAIKQWVSMARERYQRHDSDQKTWYSRFFPIARQTRGEAPIQLPKEYDLEGGHAAAQYS